MGLIQRDLVNCSAVKGFLIHEEHYKRIPSVVPSSPIIIFIADIAICATGGDMAVA